ncbi:MAG TPA: hypothetical protein VGC54_00935 [Planctomycetota bacterium]
MANIKIFRDDSSARGERGSVLLLTLVFASLLAMLTLSNMASIRAGLQISRNEATSVRAELAAESALAYALRRFKSEPAWEGTPVGESVRVGAGEFRVVVLDRTPHVDGGELVQLELQGWHDELSHFRMASRLRVSPGNSLSDKALMLFGGRTTDLGDTVITGDVLICDREHTVRDWIPATREWIGGRPEQIDSVLAPNLLVAGTVEKFTDTVYSPGSNEEKISGVVNSPEWDMEPYLVAHPNSVIRDFTGNPAAQIVLDGEIYEATNVIVLRPSQDVMIKDGRYYGGMVVYAEPTWDLRGMPRNRVDIKHPPSVFGGGTGGMHPHIGLIAPAGVLKINCAHGQVFDGFNFWGASEYISTGKSYFSMTGLWIIMNDAWVRGGTMQKDPAVGIDLPPGFSVSDTSSNVEFLSVWETYDPVL